MNYNSILVVTIAQKVVGVDRSPIVIDTKSHSELAADMQEYCYTIKIMNPERKSDYVIGRFQSVGRLSNISSLKF